MSAESVNWPGVRAKITVAVGALWLLAVVYGLHPFAVRYPGRYRIPWETGCNQRECGVDFAIPGGPAEGKLQWADRFVSVNGKSGFSIERYPELITRQLRPGEMIDLVIRRNKQLETISIPVAPVPAGPGETAAPVTMAVLALAFFIAGGVAFWQRPELAAARWFALATCLVSLRFVSISAGYWAQPWDVGAVDGWLGFVGWLYLPAAYCFLRSFPVAPPPSRFGLWLDRAVAVGGTVLFVYQALMMLPFLVLPEWSWEAASLPRQLGIRAFTRGEFLVPFFGMAGLLAGVTSYRATREPAERRRARLLLAAIVLALVCQLPYALRVWEGQVAGIVTNLTGIVVPITLVYTIRRHRVMGIRLILRLGLQYLMARGVLLVVLASPILVAVYRVLTNPSMPAGELFGGRGPGVLMAGAGVLLVVRQPLLQSLDSRFFRNVWDAEHLLESVLGEIQKQSSLRGLVGTVTSHLNRAMYPSSIDIYWRIARAGDFCAIGRAAVASSSKFGKWLDGAGRVDAVPVAELPEAAGFPVRAGENALVVTMPGSAGQASGFVLLGEKRSQEPWTKQERRLLRVMAGQLGLRHEVLLLEEEQLTAVDDERRRMSRELHDSLSQGFAGIFLHLESARNYMEGDPEKSRAHVEEASGLAQHSLASARASIRNLRSYGAGVDLERELRDLAVRLQVGPSVRIDCRAGGEQAVPEQIGWHLLRIAEEAVTNAIKHSGGGKITVRLHTSGASARLSIRDDGQGFEPGELRASGYGLIGMRERVEEMGGVLEVISSRGQGAEVNVVVPLPEAMGV